MNCPKCQTPVAADWALCPKCGILLNQPPIGVGIPLVEVKRPSRWHYFLGIAIILITSAIAMVILIVSMLTSLMPDTRVVVPGTHQLALNKTGGYIIYHEYQSNIDGKLYYTKSVSGIKVYLYDSASKPVELKYPSTTTSYEINGKAGKSVMEFWIHEPGTYTLVANYSAGESGPDIVLAIGESAFFGAFIKSFIIGTFGLILGLIVIIRAAVKRRSIGRRVGVTTIDRFWC